MSKSVNRVTLLGNVGKDPEIRSTGGGMTVANFSIATTERSKQGGEWKDSTEWHSLCAFGKTAEVIRDYVRKGSKLFVEGRLQTRSWDDKATGEKKYRTEIVVNDLTLCGGGAPGKPQSISDVPTTKAEYEAQSPIDDSDIPF